MIASLHSLLVLGMVLLAAYGVGRPVLRGLGVSGDDRLSTAAWSLGLGLIVVGTAVGLLGMVGMLYPVLLATLTPIAALWGLAEWVGSRAERHEERPLDDAGPESRSAPSAAWREPPKWLVRGMMCLAAIAAGGSLVAALAPPTAGDALCYHLELPKTFLLDHRIGFLPDHENSTFPLLAEMWYAWGLALDGPVAAQLVHWAAGVLLALATVLLASPIVGRSWARLAGGLVLLVPGVTNQMTAPLNDAALALACTLAFAAWWRGAITDEGRRWFVVAGLAAGGALATKYVALVFAAAFAVHFVWLVVAQPQRRGLLVQGAAVVAVVAASVAGPWYVRAAHHRGNPVYPFLSEVFPAELAANTPDKETLPESKSPLGRHPLGLATAAWHITFEPERFGGRGHQLGGLFLAVLPGLAWARRLRGLGWVVGLAAAYWVAWFLLRQNVRFLMPIVPLLAVMAVWVWMEMQRLPSIPRRVAAAALAVLLGAGAAIGVARARDGLGVAVGWESRDDYLVRHEPTWKAADVAAHVLRPGDHLLSQDYRAYYFPCRVTRENTFRQRTQYDRQLASPQDLGRHLRQAGFTHLLLAENQGPRGIDYDPVLSRLVDRAADGSDEFLTLVDYRFADADGGVRRYRLVRLR